MFDRLIDLLLQWIGFFIPFVVIDAFERGVVLRFGVKQRELDPGLHWIIPFQVDRVIADNVVPRTINLGAQTLTTQDGKVVTVAGVVTARISDISKATLEVENVDTAVEDSCYGAIGFAVASATWDVLQQEDFSVKLTKACRGQGWRYGIEIQRVQLSDLCLTRVIRLHNG
jgi:regulator of protease activity HflC (stomatin/prohibitin superfamily)